MSNNNVVTLKLVKKINDEGKINEEKIQQDILSCDCVLQAAQGNLSMVLIIGEMPDRSVYCAASTGNKADILMAVENFKRNLLNGAYD
jgi:hypothetical protein